MWRVVSSGALFALSALVIGHGCDNAPFPKCGPLPDAASCPIADGGSCTDTDCTAIYTCEDDTWQLTETCPVHAGGAGGTGGADGTGGDGGTGGGDDCTAVTTSSDDGGCDDLELPDCSDTLLEGCPEEACSTGCLDFLTCKNGEWSDRYAAYCDDDGNLVRNPAPTN